MTTTRRVDLTWRVALAGETGPRTRGAKSVARVATGEVVATEVEMELEVWGPIQHGWRCVAWRVLQWRTEGKAGEGIVRRDHVEEAPSTMTRMEWCLQKKEISSPED
jgi:hypothetical protein